MYNCKKGHAVIISGRMVCSGRLIIVGSIDYCASEVMEIHIGSEFTKSNTKRERCWKYEVMRKQSATVLMHDKRDTISKRELST